MNNKYTQKVGNYLIKDIKSSKEVKIAASFIFYEFYSHTFEEFLLTNYSNLKLSTVYKLIYKEEFNIDVSSYLNKRVRN